MFDFLVIGGGIIGMLTARELSSIGNVCLVERGRTGREASWAGGGILSPLYPWRYVDAVTQLAGLSQARYRSLAEELSLEGRTDPEWIQSGLLVLDPGERSRASAWARKYGSELQSLQGPALRACEPRLNKDFGEGLWMPKVAQLRNPRLVRALRGSMDVSGVEVKEGNEVTGLVVEKGRIQGVRTNQGLLSAGTVVVAGGAWSAGLLAGLGPEVAVAPVRGQMVLYRAEPGFVSRIVLYRNRYIIPRRDGRVVVGSTLEHSGFDKSTSGEARRELEAAATELIPGLAQWPIEHHWAGLRPSSPGGVPYIGPWPGVDGLYVNAGHFRNGVVLGLASAGLLADLVLGRTPRLDPAPYAVNARRPTDACL